MKKLILVAVLATSPSMAYAQYMMNNSMPYSNPNVDNRPRGYDGTPQTYGQNPYNNNRDRSVNCTSQRIGGTIQTNCY
jgi:hypothetical protein